MKREIESVRETESRRERKRERELHISGNKSLDGHFVREMGLKLYI